MNARKLFAAAALLLGASAVLPAFAGAVDLGEVQKGSEKVTWSTVQGEGDAKAKANDLAMRIFGIAKTVASGLAIFYLVYNGFMMVVSYANEDTITKCKTQLWYAVVALLFINIPGQIVTLFTDKKTSLDPTAKVGSNAFSLVDTGCSNLIFCPQQWTNGIGHSLMAFLELGLVAGAVFMFSLAAFKLIANRGDPEDRVAIKSQFLYGGMALVFVGVIEMWVKVVAESDIKGAGSGIFANLMNLGLLFAGPLAIFFLSWAAYLYITSNGDEEKVKQAKSILVTTFMATLLLLATYAFLKDLGSFLG